MLFILVPFSKITRKGKLLFPSMLNAYPTTVSTDFGIVMLSRARQL